MAVLTQATLQTLMCDDPECKDPHTDQLIVHSRCHPYTPMWAEYTRSTGILTLNCADCDRIIERFLIAPGRTN